MNLVYLTLEAPREGHASYTHVHEIIKGLRARSWSVRLYQPSYTHRHKSPPLFLRLILCMWLQACLFAQWKRGSILYIRAHYLAFPTALIARLLNIPIFHEVNGPYDDVFIVYPSLNKFRRVLIWMQKTQYRWATGLISVTQPLCDWVSKEAGGAYVHFIPNGANTDLFHPDYGKMNGLPPQYAIFFGGMARWHRISTVIEAFEAEAWPQDVELVIIGDGPEFNYVVERAAHNKRIHVLGRKPYQLVPAYVANALCGLVTTSNVEDSTSANVNAGQRGETGLFPLKLFETLACGIPAIVTDFPGQADLVLEGRCGVVIPPDDYLALAEAVRQLASNPEMASDMGQRGHILVKENHSWDARAEATNKIIQTCLNKLYRQSFP